VIDRERRAIFGEQLQRRRGRPRTARPTAVISVRVSQDVYDRLCRQALEQREPLPVVVRAALGRAISCN
jgi:hypothetical protein